jgi:hypothetical protein
MHGLPLDNTRTHVLLYQAGETATLAGQTRSPHTPQTGASCCEHLVRLALLVTGRVPPECALAQLGRWTGRLRRRSGQTVVSSTGEALIPTANAVEGEPISISRLQAGSLKRGLVARHPNARAAQSPAADAGQACGEHSCTTGLCFRSAADSTRRIPIGGTRGTRRFPFVCYVVFL